MMMSLSGRVAARQDDQPGNLRVRLADSGDSHSAEAVAQDEHALGIDSLGGPQPRCRIQRVIDGLLFEGNLLDGSRQLRAVLFGAFLVAENGNASGGQPPGQVAERFVGPHRLVAVLGPEPWTRTTAGQGPPLTGTASVPGKTHWPVPTVNSRSRKASLLA